MKKPDLNGWSITPPSAKEHCFYFTLRRRGVPVRAFLTYQLSKNQGTPKRGRLLIKRSLYQRLNNVLEEEDVQLLDKIEKMIRGYRAIGKGKIESQKSIVNSIYDGDFPIPGFEVAIHKHGPVPVYVLPGEHELNVYGETIAAQIVVYQDVPSPAAGADWPVALSNRAEYLRSLEIQPDLIFQRYFEDVAESLFDMEHHLGFVEAVRAAVQAESVLSASVDEKIKQIRDFKTYQKNQPAAAEIAQKILAEHPDVILRAQFFRAGALYLLHEFYSLFGLASDSRKDSNYPRDVEKLRESFDSQFGDGSFDEVIKENPESWHLREALDSYAADDYDWRPVVPSDSRWVRRLVDFSVFLRTLLAHKVSPQSARIFLSLHHDLGVSELVRSALDRFIAERYSGNIRLLSVKEEKAGASFRNLISSRIWLSDSVAVFVPRSVTGNDGIDQKDYSWLFREIEHALGLGKRVAIFMEEGADEEAIRKEWTSSDVEFLSVESRRQNRREEVLKFFDDGVRPSFRQKSGQALDSGLAEAMSVEASLAMDRHLESFILGALQFFTPREREAIELIHSRYSATPRAKKDLAPLVFHGGSGKRAMEEFDRFRTRILRHKVTIAGKSYEIIGLAPGNSYRSRLTEIAMALRWDASWPLSVIEAKLAGILKKTKSTRP
jgi:hypothetical protein